MIEAQQADEALVFLQSAAVTVNAVFTDVNMPGKMNGVELAHETRRCWPWIHLLVTSALLKPPTSDLPERCRFLPKPYKVERVIDHIREMIAAQM